MAIRPTVQLGDPSLRAALPDTSPDADLGAVARDLRDTLGDWVQRSGYGRGIAAPQIRSRVRMVHVRLGPDRLLLDPRITWRSEETWQPWEGCLSFGLAFFCRARRSTEIGYEHTTLDGRRRSGRAKGAYAHLLQHEIDHLDGILAVDRMDDATTMCTRAEFEKRHRDESPYRR